MKLFISLLIPLGVLGAILGLCIFMISCFDDPSAGYKFEIGEKVRHQLDNRIGIIVDREAFREEAFYNVRFVCNKQSQGHYGPIHNAPYAVVECLEFELVRMGEK